MKKILITAAVTGLIGGMAFAQTNVVSSANVVGYNQITIPSNQYVLVSLGFDNNSNTVENLFGTLPSGSSVIIWDTENQRYKTIARTRAGWDSGKTNRISIGMGAFVTLPANVQTNIYFSGDVPMAETTAVYKVNGYTLVSFPYPTDTAFTNTALYKNSVSGDSVSLWTNGWATYSKTRAGWSAGTTNIQLKVGQAFFYKSTSSSAANEVKPYTIN